jgi:hypothetical protein
MTVLARASSNLTDRPTELTAEVGGWKLGASPAREIAAEASGQSMRLP